MLASQVQLMQEAGDARMKPSSCNGGFIVVPFLGPFATTYGRCHSHPRSMGPPGAVRI